MPKFKIAVCQMRVTANKEANLAKAQGMLEEAQRAGAFMAVLPEMFNCPYDNAFFPSFAESSEGGPTTKMLAQAARKGGLYVVGGSIPEREGDRYYNTCFVFNPGGEKIARHRKAHLFDVDIPGKITFRESEVLSPGHDITLFESPFGRVGVAICYDIRFPEYSRRLSLDGAVMMVVPAAFNMVSGPAHWEPALRVRALDNQYYVVGAAPARDEQASYVSYGHSMVIEPFGTVVASADEKEALLVAEVDTERVENVRREFPLLKHRRPVLYHKKVEVGQKP